MRTPSAGASMGVLFRPHAITGPVALFVVTAVVAALPATSAAASPIGPSPAVTLPAEVHGLQSGEVKELLSGVPLEDVSAAQLGEVLSQLPGLGDLPAGKLQEALTKAIEKLAGEGDSLGNLSSDPAELVSALETKLKGLLLPTELLGLELPLELEGKSLGDLLSGGLGSPEPGELIDGLLSSAAEPEQLLEQVLSEVNPAKLETLLGSKLAGEPINETTVGELASTFETTDEALASSVGTTVQELPASAMALTAPLADGKTLGVLDGAKELSLATLVPPTESGSGGSGGSSGSGGAGGSGGSGGASGTGGASGSGAPGSTTVIVDDLQPQSASPADAAAKDAATKIEIVSRKVRGNAVTLVVKVPAAGRLALAGKGVRSVSKQTSTAERITLRTVLTKAGAASRRAHRHGVKIKLDVSFKPVNGSRTVASVSVTFG